MQIIKYYRREKQGKYGADEKVREFNLRDYLDTIIKYAEGYGQVLRPLVTSKGGRVDTELITKLVDRIFEFDTTKRAKRETEFYRSYLYCVIALMSVEFDITPEDDPETDMHAYTFPSSFSYIPPLDFEMLIDYSEMRSEDGMIGFSIEFFPEHLCILYYLLTWKHISIPTAVDYTFPDVDYDLFEPFDDISEEEYERIMRESIELRNEEMQIPPISSDEAHERNILSSDRLKALYPGYSDYVSHMDNFLKLYDKYASEDFGRILTGLISDYLICDGHSLYSDEKKYMNVMIHLNRAKKAVSKQQTI